MIGLKKKRTTEDSGCSAFAGFPVKKCYNFILVWYPGDWTKMGQTEVFLLRDFIAAGWFILL